MSRSRHLHQSVEIVQFLSTLGGGAIVVWVVWQLVEQPMAYVDNNATGLLATSNEWFDILITHLPLIFLFIAAMGSLAWTVFKSNFA